MLLTELPVLDYLSLIIALVALLYSVNEIRRNNNIIVKILKCSSFYHSSDREKPSCRIEVVIKNRGMTLYSPGLHLSFKGEQGTLNLVLKPKNEDFIANTFSKGMIAAFGYDIYNTEQDVAFVRHLISFDKKETCLELYSQNYLSKKFRANDFLDRIKQLCNQRKMMWLFLRRKSVMELCYTTECFVTLGDQIEKLLFLYNDMLKDNKQEHKQNKD